MTKIQRAAAALIDRHGTLRAAEAATGISYSYLARLRDGSKTNPSGEVLRKLGFRREERLIEVRP
jgi:hypothetical protein